MTTKPHPTKTKTTVADDNRGNIVFQKIYIKDISYESPNAPQIFSESWTPEVGVDFGFEHTHISGSNYEVELTVRVSAHSEKRTVFLTEVKMAGLFSLSGFSDKTMSAVLGSYCPGMIFPYVRELITELSTRGGFMPMILAPANFDVLYTQRMQENSAKEQP